ncbi:MAG: peptide-methionine (S)-S-oxide reductase MsrA [Pseudomonadota bacterium]|nr:peptide-methionine (S)-S-oxide reductase MsrA [Pseudomonadota bacterium]
MTTRSNLSSSDRIAGTAGRLAAWVGAAALALGALHLGNSSAAEAAVRIPPPARDDTAGATAMQTAVFAGGCFWGVQGVFQRVDGVIQAVSGYAGGKKETAHYEMVGSGLTGHAESVMVSYDPKKVSYGKLLQIYFSVAHDPTQLNRQDPDSGPQYRSAVFYSDPAQKQTAERYIAQLDAAKAYPRKIVTQVVPLNDFFPAEAYHQDYLTLHPESGYIARFDLPKIAELKNLFPQQFRAEPALVTARLQQPTSKSQ